MADSGACLELGAGSVYFHDPEGSIVEVFLAAGRKDIDRPYADPISIDDLERSESELLTLVGGSA